MSTQRAFLLAGSVALLSVASAACGGDAKNPKIKSFTASPATLPSLGGETTLLWDVKNAESLELEPGIGAVSGTALTISVSETTEFTLIAKKNGRTSRKKTTVTCVSPGALTGLVRFTTVREPVANIAVMVNGQATVTDEAGRFYFDDVPTPYSVSIFASEAPFVLEYRGLTRFDPILEFPIAIVSGPTLTASGVVTPTTVAPDTYTLVDAKTTSMLIPSNASADNGTGDYAANLTFTCLFDCPPETDKATAVATRFTWPGTGLATYTHLGRTTKDVDPNAPAPTDFNVTLSPVSNAVSSLQYTYSSLVDWVPFQATMVLDSATGATTDVGLIIPAEAVALGTNDDLQIASPDVDGQVQLWSQFTDTTTGSIGIHAARFSPGDEVTVEPPVLPRILTPLDGGVVRDETKFQLYGNEGSVRMFSFQGPNAQAFVFTTESSITLPQYPEAGIVFTEGTLSFSALEIFPSPSTNDVAGPDGLFGTNPEMWAFTQPIDLYYEPAAGAP